MTFLVHWLWQGLAVAAAAALALRLLPRLNGATRHAILWVALATIVALPLAWPDAVALPPVSPAAAVLPDEGGVVLPAVPSWVVGAAIGAWIGWAVVGIARIGAGWRRLLRTCDQAKPLPAHLLARLTEWPPLTAGSRQPDVRVSRAIRGACAIGFGRPVVLLSADLVDALEPDALCQVVMHEQAHIDRGDHWGRLVQSLVEALAGLHPAVTYILRRLELEREVACDAHVVSRTRAARDYARSLVDAAAVAARSRAPHVPAVVPGALRSRSGLRARVERLLSTPAGAPPHARRPALAASVLAAGVTLGAAGAMAPAVVFVDLLLEGPRAALAPLAAWHLPALPGLVAPRVPAFDTAFTALQAPDRPRDDRRVTAPEPGQSATAVAVPVDRIEEATVILEGRPVGHAFASLMPAVDDSAPAPASPPGTWSRAAEAGRGVGQAAERTGAAIGDAAARGGTVIGQRAKRTGTSLAGFFARAF